MGLSGGSFVTAFTNFVGQGANKMDKTLQVARVQAELSQLNKDIDEAYANLGRVVLQGEGANKSFLKVYEVPVSRVRALEQRAAEAAKTLEDLNRVEQKIVSNAPTGTCPTCGATVPVDAVRCHMCGDNLEALKAQYRICPSCNTIYGADVAYCIKDGTPTTSLPVAPPLAAADIVSPQPQGVTPQTNPAPTVPQGPVCPVCGTQASPEDAFCAVCGAPLRA